MGGFAQALTSGVGEGGEAFSRGALANYGQLLSNIDTAHKQAMDDAANAARTRQLDLEQQQQSNYVDISKQSIALQQKAMENAGWQLAGETRNDDGTYMRNFIQPWSQKQVSVPMPKGYYPVGSFEDQQHIASQLHSAYPHMTDEQVAGIAFKAPVMQRADAGSLMRQFMNDATVDPTLLRKGQTPRAYAQDLVDLTFGRGQYLRYGFGASANAAGAYGLTADEKRQFDAQMAPIKSQQAAITDSYNRSIASIQQTVLDPVQASSLIEGLTKNFYDKTGELSQQEEAIASNIIKQRHPGQGATAESGAPTGQTWSKSAWLAANKNGDEAAAEKAAKAKGYKVVP